MGSLSKKVFISYVQEDGAVAYEIAAGLESQGYSSWYYERDCPAGADYFEETHKAISDCEAMVIVISPRSLPSDQITREIVRAVESSKATFPLLLEVTHDDYAHRRPGWHQAMAAELEALVAASWKEAVSFGTMTEGPRLDADLMFEDVFKEMPQNLQRQQALMRKERNS